MRIRWIIVPLEEYDRLLEAREIDRRVHLREIAPGLTVLSYSSPGLITYCVTDAEAHKYRQPCPSCGGLTLPGRCEWHG